MGESASATAGAHNATAAIAAASAPIDLSFRALLTRGSA
jgi:hypothetical protein